MPSAGSQVNTSAAAAGAIGDIRTKTTNSATDINTHTGTSVGAVMIPFTIFSNWSAKNAQVAVADDNASVGGQIPGGSVAGESAHTYGYGFGYGTGREIDDGDYGSVAGAEHDEEAAAGIALSEEQLVGLFGT
jgi:hypothetical protein